MLYHIHLQYNKYKHQTITCKQRYTICMNIATRNIEHVRRKIKQRVIK